MYACTFIGHKECSEHIKQTLYTTVEYLIAEKNVDTFYVGTHGRFDRFAYEVLCELEGKYKIDMFVVLAYLNQNKKYVYYDLKKTIFSDVLEKTPLRFAISKRDLYMIGKAQYMISCIDNTFSNAFSFVREAIRKKRIVINLGKYDLHIKE